jgi:hypothetical protein
VKPYLLDVNVLLALAWPNHVHHAAALTWFSHKGAARFRTCPLTQTGFVGVSSNSAFTSAAVSPGEAVRLLKKICALPGHEFWPDDISLAEAQIPPAAMVGHRQVTDAYLVSLAAAHDGVLATLDRGVAAALGGRGAGAVEFIG